LWVANTGFCGVFFVELTDLLYKDYHTDQKFTLTTYASNGAVSFHIVRLL